MGQPAGDGRGAAPVAGGDAPRASRRAHWWDGGVRATPAVFLDRDGVLNAPVVVDGRPHPPRSAAEMRLLPGVEAACAQLRDAGFALVCVTNQPDIARGTITAARSEERRVGKECRSRWSPY